MKDKKYPFWYYGVLALIPFALVFLIEVSLRIANYGNDYTVFVKISDQFNNLLFFNPKLPQKYFTDKTTVPSVIPDGFEKIQREKSFRIFVLGGSSTAGFPYPRNASFSRQLKRKLEIIYPNMFFEVINLGVSAVNTNTIRDYIDEVLDQNPDLIIFYAGHNEYYGADGIASNSIFAGNTRLISFQNSLRELKIYQFLNNILNSVFSKTNSDKKSKTLMSEMAGSNLIEFESDDYYSGLNQFENNLEYILTECKNRNTEVLLCDLVSNLKQEPLDKIINKTSEANKIFASAQLSLDKDGNEARELFIKAKEEDSFRFRAPEKINEIIKEKSKSFNYSFVSIDAAIKERSENLITDYNLFVDHLHPNIEGHKIISDVIFNKIVSMDILSNQKRTVIDSSQLEGILKSSFPFTKYDSVFSEIKVKILLNSYPFEKKISTDKILKSYTSINSINELAARTVSGKISWENAHQLIADNYMKEGNNYFFFKEFWSLIEDKPFEKSNYIIAVQKLMEKREYNLARIILLKYNRNYEDAFSTNNLGKLYGELKNFSAAVNYLEKSLKYVNNDPDVYFRLAIYNLELKRTLQAAEAINNCIRIDPTHKNAVEIQNYIKRLQNTSK